MPSDYLGHDLTRCASLSDSVILADNLRLVGSAYLGPINVSEQEETNFDSLMKKHGKGNEMDLSEYKILGEGELTRKLTIKALAFSESAKEKIEKAGGNAVVVENKESQDKTDARTESNARVQDILNKKLESKKTPVKKGKK